MRKFAWLSVVALSLGVVSMDARGQEAPLQSVMSSYTGGEVAYSPDQLLVKFSETASASAIEAAHQWVAADDVRTYQLVPGLQRLSIGVGLEQALRTLISLPFVEYAEPDYYRYPTATPNDTYFNLQWGIHNTGQTIQGQVGTPDAARRCRCGAVHDSGAAGTAVRPHRATRRRLEVLRVRRSA